MVNWVSTGLCGASIDSKQPSTCRSLPLPAPCALYTLLQHTNCNCPCGGLARQIQIDSQHATYGSVAPGTWHAQTLCIANVVTAQTAGRLCRDALVNVPLMYKTHAWNPQNYVRRDDANALPLLGASGCGPCATSMSFCRHAQPGACSVANSKTTLSPCNSACSCC